MASGCVGKAGQRGAGGDVCVCVFTPLSVCVCVSRTPIQDPYDISLLGCPRDSDGYKEALTLLQTHNKNDVTSTGVDWTLNMKGEEKRYMPYNGAFGKSQIEWLESVVKDATLKKEHVVILTHVSLYRPASRNLTVVWNREDVWSIMDRYRGVCVWS